MCAQQGARGIASSNHGSARRSRAVLVVPATLVKAVGDADNAETGRKEKCQLPAPRIDGMQPASASKAFKARAARVCTAGECAGADEADAGQTHGGSVSVKQRLLPALGAWAYPMKCRALKFHGKPRKEEAAVRRVM